MKSILDKSFKYTPSFETDLRKTFARVHREQRLAAQEEQQARDEQRRKAFATEPATPTAVPNVSRIRRRTA
jgi:hypothetical protein